MWGPQILDHWKLTFQEDLKAPWDGAGKGTVTSLKMVPMGLSGRSWSPLSRDPTTTD